MKWRHFKSHQIEVPDRKLNEKPVTVIWMGNVPHPLDFRRRNNLSMFRMDKAAPAFVASFVYIFRGFLVFRLVCGNVHMNVRFCVWEIEQFRLASKMQIPTIFRMGGKCINLSSQPSMESNGMELNGGKPRTRSQEPGT